MREILVVGSAGYDTISTPKGHVDNTLGGSANYFSFGASLYSKVNVVGVVGQDYSDEHRKLLIQRGIDIEGLQTANGETFRWSGKYEKGAMDEAITLATHLNVFRDFSPRLPAPYKKSPFVFLANIDPVLQMEVLDQVENPRLVGLDTMNFWIDSKPRELEAAIRRVDVLLMNEGEAQKLSGEENTIKAVKSLSRLGPKAVIVKRGEYGFVLYSEERFYIAPAFPVEEVVDPTGAGDSFAGGFFGYLSKLNGKMSFRDLQEACVHGAVVASFTVEDFGLNALVQLNSTKVDRRLSAFTKVVSL